MTFREMIYCFKSNLSNPLVLSDELQNIGYDNTLILDYLRLDRISEETFDKTFKFIKYKTYIHSINHNSYSNTILNVDYNIYIIKNLRPNYQSKDWINFNLKTFCFSERSNYYIKDVVKFDETECSIKLISRCLNEFYQIAFLESIICCFFFYNYERKRYSFRISDNKFLFNAGTFLSKCFTYD